MVLSLGQGVSNVVGTATMIGGLSDPATATQISGQLTASQGGSGLSSIGVNQAPVGTSAGIFAASLVGERLIAYATNLVMTASGDDVLTMSNAANLGQYIIRRITWGFPITSALATVVVIATVRTASGGGGSAVTGNLVVTGLSATTSYLDQTITLASAAVSSTQLYVNVTTAAATAPSSQLFVFGHCLGV